MQTFVAVLMWLLVASLLVLRRGRAERSITYAAITIAVAMTINVDAVYRPIDATPRRLECRHPHRRLRADGRESSFLAEES